MMIIKKIKNKSCKGGSARRICGLIAYVMDDEKSEVVFAINMNENIAPLLAVEMCNNEPISKKCKDPVEHIVVSIKQNEVMTHQQAYNIAQITLQRLDYSNCQAVCSLQSNTDNMHLHIVVNRTDPATKQLHDNSNDYYKMQAAAAICEYKHGYKSEPNALYTVDNGHIVRTNKHSNSNTISECIESHSGIESNYTTALMIAKEIINTSQNWQELHERLILRGIVYEKKNNGATFGLNIENNGFEYVKASLVSREYSLKNLEKKFGAFIKSKNTNKYKQIVKHIIESKPTEKAIAINIQESTEYKKPVHHDAPITTKGQQYEYDYTPATVERVGGITRAAGMSRTVGLSGTAVAVQTQTQQQTQQQRKKQLRTSST